MPTFERKTVNMVSSALFTLALSACASEPTESESPSAEATAPGHIVIGQDVPHTDKRFLGSPDNFQFVIVGDRTGGHRPGVFDHAMDQVNWLQPEFVMCVGDLIEGYSEDTNQLAAEWDELDGMLDKLQMPFFYTVGNHDMGNNVMRNLWHQRHGRDYYHFLYKDVLFISLNTEDPPIELSPETRASQQKLKEMRKKDPGGVRKMLAARRAETGHSSSERPKLPGKVAISDEQVAYVEKVLTNNPEVRWTLFFMHKPSWEYENENPQFAQIEALVQDRPYTMIAGHEHYYSYSNRHGRDYIDMGTTGGIWLSDGPGSVDHVTWVTMTDQGPVVANIALEGLLDKHGPQSK